MSKPEGLFLVLSDGRRVPIDLRFSHVDERGIRFWDPLIEGDITAIIPDVVAFDGPRVENNECITLPATGTYTDTAEWGRMVMANSKHVFGWYEPK